MSTDCSLVKYIGDGGILNLLYWQPVCKVWNSLFVADTEQTYALGVSVYSASTVSHGN